MTSRCYNSPCALKPGHSGPCRSSTSDPYIALLDEPMGYAYAIATADGHVLVHLERGTTRNESEGGVEKLLALLNRTQETQAAGVTEAMVEAACAVFGWIKPSQYAISSMRAALEAAERVRNAGPKLAYYQTHEPPHCPTCDCAGPDEQGQK